MKNAATPQRSRLLATCLALSLAGMLWAPAAMAADLTGHWRTAYGPTLEIVQTGTSVVLTQGTKVFEGTIDGSAVELVRDNPPAPLPDTYSLVLAPDEMVLSGIAQAFVCVLSFCNYNSANVTMSRCECFDGNDSSGDGCDAECQVEACYECAGDPSTCTPVADASPCEHRSECISGGSCTAGVCEGGTQSSSCIDIGGGWLRTTHIFNDGDTFSSRSEIVQDNGAFSVLTVPGGYRETTGTLDTSSGELLIGAVSTWPYCSGKSTVSGTVAADGLSYSAIGWYEASTPRFCVGMELFGELGFRCASGNIEASDGCVANSCQRCTGDPAVCVPVPDSTPCQSSDPCSVVSTCQSGECVATISDECPACSVCDGAGGCVQGPRNNCRAPSDAQSTMLSIKHPELSLRNSLLWKWKDGAIRSFDLGRPDLYSDVAFCVFDESTSSPTLLFGGSINDDLHPWENLGNGLENGWKIGDDGSARFRDREGSDEGITSLQLDVGDSENARIKLKGKGAGLLGGGVSFSTPTFPLPLRAQIQIEGGACFEGRYDAAGVTRNADGVFRAKGTP